MVAGEFDQRASAVVDVASVAGGPDPVDAGRQPGETEISPLVHNPRGRLAIVMWRGIYANRVDDLPHNEVRDRASETV